jgi:hypothetical protein
VTDPGTSREFSEREVQALRFAKQTLRPYKSNNERPALSNVQSRHLRPDAVPRVSRSADALARPFPHYGRLGITAPSFPGVGSSTVGFTETGELANRKEDFE